MRKHVFERLGMRDTIVDTSTAKDEDDPPIANLVRELIFDPRTKRGNTSASTKQPVPDRVTSYYPRFASDPEYGLHLMRPLDYSCYAGAGAFMSTPSDLVRFGMATRPGRYLKTVTLAGKQTGVTGQNGDSLGGMLASLIVVPESGLVVAVTSNISYADTFSLALKIADPFLQQRK
jgi:CubicO group peptidase (beta-lactamase class C family)